VRAAPRGSADVQIQAVLPQGVSDPVFSLDDTLAWYREVNELNAGRAVSFVRVFAVPGMAHCSGRPATDEFDAFAALVKWVEQGKAPDRILAKAGPGTPWPGRTRPLCPYPEYARYSGRGSIDKASSFRCVRLSPQVQPAAAARAGAAVRGPARNERSTG
jgi:Tannase and feruloyl esterase